MSYKDWAALFGRTTIDPVILAKLTQAGVTKRPVVPKQSTDVRVDIPGITLVFKSANLFPNVDAGSGVGVLNEIILFLESKSQGTYNGELPFDLQRTNSQTELRSRFGEPFLTNTTFNWDKWEIDGRILHAKYGENLDRLVMVTLATKIPDSDG